MVVVPGIVVVSCKTRAQFSGRFQSVGSLPFEDLLGIDDCLHLLLLVLDVHLHLDLNHVRLEFVELLLVLESYELLWHEFNIERLFLRIVFRFIMLFLAHPVGVGDFEVQHVAL